jgi:hypothetical protein
MSTRRAKTVAETPPPKIHWWNGRFGLRSSFEHWQEMPLWRKALCHALPVAAALLVTGVLYGLAMDRNEPRAILHSIANPAIAHPGQIISVTYTAADEKECSGTVHRWITDSKGALYVLPDATVFHNYGIVPGKPFEFNREIRVPYSIALGTATYHAITERWCNPLQEYFWRMHSEDRATFTVTAGPDTPAPGAGVNGH